MYLILAIKNDSRLLFKSIKNFKYLSIRSYSNDSKDSKDKPSSQLNERIREKFKKLNKNDQQIKTSEFSHPKRQTKSNEQGKFGENEFDNVGLSREVSQFMPRTNEDLNKDVKVASKGKSKAFGADYIKDLIGINRTPDEYYFERDQMDSKLNTLVYYSNMSKKYEIIFFLFTLALPFYGYYIYLVFMNKYDAQLSDEFYMDEDDAKSHIYIVTFASAIFALQSFLLIYYLRTHPSVIYFNEKSRKFTVVLRQFPLSKWTKKILVNSGGAQLDPPKNTFSQMLQTNANLLVQNKRIHINSELFTKPLYSNLIFGFTKPNR